MAEDNEQTNIKVTADATNKNYFTLNLEPGEQMDNSPTMAQLDNKSNYLARNNDVAIHNPKSGASVSVRDNGQINLSSSNMGQYKVNPDGRTIETSLESVAITNRRRLITDEVVINDHKLNPRLYEFTDFKKVELTTNQNALVGNFCVYGSVLVKAWEVNLKRYVMIRRPCRMPMFSPLLNLSKIMPGLNIDDPLEFEEDILALSDKGYQVTGAITDAKSLIGKEGVNRTDNNSSSNNKASADNSNASSSGSDKSNNKDSNNASDSSKDKNEKV